MKHADFARGTDFYTAAGKWRCTDVGTRVIVAISLEPREVVRAELGPDGEPRESRCISTDPHDLDGPPYGVVEHVFDEFDLGACYTSAEEASEGRAPSGDSLAQSRAARPIRLDAAPRVQLQHIAELDVSAASGLVALGDRLYVVADDEHFLACYDLSGRPLGRVALFAQELPAEPAERKRLKPDLEALTCLPSGWLLALGSGSTERRERAVLIDPRGGALRQLDLGPLYRRLRSSLPQLNIEGAAVLEDRLWLAHRGNGQSGSSACIELGPEAIERLLAGASDIESGALRAIYEVPLGELEGVPLGLTDLAALPGVGLVFCATAEDSPDTYRDGVCTGSALGVLDLQGRVRRIASTSVACKLEGLTLAQRAHSEFELWLVADPDDRTRNAPLFRVADPSALWRDLPGPLVPSGVRR